MNVTWDPMILQEFNKRFTALMEFAATAGVPQAYVEACCRDFVASIEALRLGGPLFKQFQENEARIARGVVR